MNEGVDRDGETLEDISSSSCSRWNRTRTVIASWRAFTKKASASMFIQQPVHEPRHLCSSSERTRDSQRKGRQRYRPRTPDGLHPSSNIEKASSPMGVLSKSFAVFRGTI